MKPIMWLAMLLLSSSAHAGCTGLAFSNLTNSTYSFNSGAAPALGLTVTKSNGSCSFFFTVNYGGAGSFTARRLAQGSYTIPMQIYTDSGRSKIAKIFPDASGNNDIINSTIGGGASSKTVQYYPSLGSVDPYARFGQFSDTFTITLYEGDINGYTQVSFQTVTFTYDMAKKIDLSIVDTGSAYNAADTTQSLNFGTLTTGATQTFDFVLKHNAGYTLTLSSANGGNLKHASLSDTVPYDLKVNSTSVNLAGSNTTPAVATTGLGVSSANGTRIPASVTIGTIGTARAGNYSDVITVSVVWSE